MSWLNIINPISRIISIAPPDGDDKPPSPSEAASTYELAPTGLFGTGVLSPAEKKVLVYLWKTENTTSSLGKLTAPLTWGQLKAFFYQGGMTKLLKLRERVTGETGKKNFTFVCLIQQERGVEKDDWRVFSTRLSSDEIPLGEGKESYSQINFEAKGDGSIRVKDVEGRYSLDVGMAIAQIKTGPIGRAFLSRWWEPSNDDAERHYVPKAVEKLALGTLKIYLARGGIPTLLALRKAATGAADSGEFILRGSVEPTGIVGLRLSSADEKNDKDAIGSFRVRFLVTPDKKVIVKHISGNHALDVAMPMADVETDNPAEKKFLAGLWKEKKHSRGAAYRPTEEKDQLTIEDLINYLKNGGISRLVKLRLKAAGIEQKAEKFRLLFTAYQYRVVHGLRILLEDEKIRHKPHFTEVEFGMTPKGEAFIISARGRRALDIATAVAGIKDIKNPVEEAFVAGLLGWRYRPSVLHDEITVTGLISFFQGGGMRRLVHLKNLIGGDSATINNLRLIGQIKPDGSVIVLRLVPNSSRKEVKKRDGLVDRFSIVFDDDKGRIIATSLTEGKGAEIAEAINAGGGKAPPPPKRLISPRQDDDLDSLHKNLNRAFRINNREQITTAYRALAVGLGLVRPYQRGTLAAIGDRTTLQMFREIAKSKGVDVDNKYARIYGRTNAAEERAEERRRDVFREGKR